MTSASLSCLYRHISQLCHRPALCLLPLWLACGLALLVNQAVHAADGQLVDQPVLIASNSFPNDPGYQQGKAYGFDLVNVRGAWQYTFGDPRVAVALIDTGIDFTHPELADHIHPAARTFFLQGQPQDEDGHGTRTAGIIAATAHNQLGMAGIAPNVQILPIKVSPGAAAMSSEHTITSPDYNFHEPIRYAAAADGVKAININFATSIEDPQEGKAIYEAMLNGVLVVAAAGNSGKDTPLYPAAYDCVLGVGAVDQQRNRASFSTYGLGVDVVAPGVSIYSTTLANRGDGYDYGNGTSFASPYVSGVAALIFSARPDLTAWDVREIIMRSAQDLGTPGFDPHYGYGLVDAGAALQLASHWRAGSGKMLNRCTGERYRVYGSLYYDDNQDGLRTAGDRPFSEPYTNTTTFVELYARNGEQRLDVTYPNHSGIFTFDTVYNPADAPYVIKVQNSVTAQPLFFAAHFSGNNDIDMGRLTNESLLVAGTFFVDENQDGLQSRNEVAYQYWGERPVQAGLFVGDSLQPVAITTGNEQGNFRFYLAPVSTTVTYTLRSLLTPEIPQLSHAYTVVIQPATTQLLDLLIGIDADSVPVEGQNTMPNSTPLGLQATVVGNRIVLRWETAQALRSDSIYEIGFTTQPGGPYQPLTTTTLGQSISQTLFDLQQGTYYLAVRARTSNGDHPEWWSAYSNEVTVTVAQSPITQTFLPIITR